MPEINEEIKNKIKSVLSLKGFSLASFVAEYNKLNPENPTTAQNLSNKFSRGSLRLDELVNMMDAIEYDVILRDRQNEKNITVIEPK